MKALRALEVASLGQQTAKERCEELPAVLWVLNSSNSPRGLVRLEPIHDSVEPTSNAL